jgi:hypothetical protein
MRLMQMRIISISVWLTIAAPVFAAERLDDTVYQDPERFVAAAFAGMPPAPKALWIDAELREALQVVLGHQPTGLRIRYWGQNGRTVWVLDEIGKQRPITSGVVIDHGAIEDIRVLVFRESRGWEIRHSFFTRQFHDARLTSTGQLTEPIDGITGATLSVRAMQRIAKAALVLHERSDEGSLTLADSH